MDEADRQAKARCERFLSLHVPTPPSLVLRQLAAMPAADEATDVYGEGGAVAALERRTAALLGKPAARFFIKGVIAQLCVLRVHAQTRGTNGVALHPLSHLDLDEANAIERVDGVAAVRLGRFQPFTATALAAITEPLAAVVVELPLRRAGYLLPPLDELRAIADWCRARGVPLHFDGARLWEAAAGYGIPVADLAALADTVYVSFYKGLGGLGGAIVAGPEETIRALDVWKLRHGGHLFTAYPYALSALDGLDSHVDRMPAYVARARSLAERLAAIPGLLLNPAPPHANAFQLLLPGSPAELAQRNREIAERERVWLLGAFSESAIAGRSVAEVAIGDAADHWSDDEAAGWIARFL